MPLMVTIQPWSKAMMQEYYLHISHFALFVLSPGPWSLNSIPKLSEKQNAKSAQGKIEPGSVKKKMLWSNCFNHYTMNLLILQIFTFSKVWNHPLYELSPSEELPPLLDNDVPRVDDRIPISVKVVPATKFRGPPQYNVSFWKWNLSHLVILYS